MGRTNNNQNYQKNAPKQKKQSGVSHRKLKIICGILAPLALLISGAWAFWNYFPDAPVADVQHGSIAENRIQAYQGGEEEFDEMPGLRAGVYTFLVTGDDDGFGGTDVIMVGLLDTEAGSLDVLSIPRDTAVNVPWAVKKANTYQTFAHRIDSEFEHPIYGMLHGVRKLIGYQPNNWIALELDGFVQLVDAIGGVDFNVPRTMRYSDPGQNLFIDLPAGERTLTGQQAMWVVRYRGYVTGDIGRIQMQHEFLGALVDQLLRPQNILRVDEFVNIFRENVETDMDLRNLAFFAQQFIQLDRENIRFHAVDETIGNINDHVNGISYVTLYLEPWLNLINTYFNPYNFEITLDDVEILTRNENREFFVTGGAEMFTNWAR